MGYDTIPTGHDEVDDILGGGFLRGHLIEVFGDEGSGKTSLVLDAACHCRFVYWLDLDRTFPGYMLQERTGPAQFYIAAGQNPAGVISGSIEKMVASGADMVVLDPIAVLGTRTVIDLVPALRVIALIREIPIILVNHCDMMQRSTGSSETSFYASQRLEVRFVSVEKEDGNAVGMKTAMRCVKNVASPPFRQCEHFVRFGDRREEGGKAK